MKPPGKQAQGKISEWHSRDVAADQRPHQRARSGLANPRVHAGLGSGSSFSFAQILPYVGKDRWITATLGG